MKKLATLAVILLTAFAQAQHQEPEHGSITFAVMQDLKFATIGDPDRGYDAFTKDLVFRMKWLGRKRQGKTARSVVMLEYENADLIYGFKKYSAGYGRSLDLGYTDFLNITLHYKLVPYLQVGWFDRGGKAPFTFVVGAENKVVLNKWLSVIGNHQFMPRTDNKEIYGGKAKFGYSFHLGLELNIPIYQPTKTAN